MEFASIGSGSAGNCTVVRSERGCILIDCGFSLKETSMRLARLGVSIDSITDVLVTHEHIDHLGGVATLSNRHGVRVHMTAGTCSSPAHLKRPVIGAQINVIKAGQVFELGPFQVQSVGVPHDAAEPVQFVVSTEAGKLGVISDLGHVPDAVVEAYRGCDALLIEYNHDERLLANGPYPYILKRRVGGAYGHLSNAQASKFLKAVTHDNLQQVVAIHLSETNNADYLVVDSVDTVCGTHVPFSFKPATQNQGFGWMKI